MRWLGILSAPTHRNDLGCFVELVNDRCGLGSHLEEVVRAEHELEARPLADIVGHMEVTVIEPDVGHVLDEKNGVQISGGHTRLRSNTEQEVHCPTTVDCSRTSLVGKKLTDFIDLSFVTRGGSGTFPRRVQEPETHRPWSSPARTRPTATAGTLSQQENA